MKQITSLENEQNHINDLSYSMEILINDFAYYMEQVFIELSKILKPSLQN